jgi:hypothetical protein
MVYFSAFASKFVCYCSQILSSSIRTDERKCLSIQNGEPGNTSQQHLPLKATPTQLNAVFPQKGVIRIFKQEFSNHQVPSIQHGGLQQQMYRQPTHTEQMLKDSHQQPKYQCQNEVQQLDPAIITSPNCQAPSQHGAVLPQKGAARTFKQELINYQVPSIQHGGLQQKIFMDSHQQPKYQSQNVVRQQENALVTSRKQCMDRQAPYQHNGGSGNTRQHRIYKKFTPQQTSRPQPE